MFDGIWRGMVTFFFLCVAAAFTLGVLAMWLIPKLWHWLKPIINRATA